MLGWLHHIFQQCNPDLQCEKEELLNGPDAEGFPKTRQISRFWVFKGGVQKPGRCKHRCLFWQHAKKQETRGLASPGNPDTNTWKYTLIWARLQVYTAMDACFRHTKVWCISTTCLSTRSLWMGHLGTAYVIISSLCHPRTQNKQWQKKKAHFKINMIARPYKHTTSSQWLSV